MCNGDKMSDFLKFHEKQEELLEEARQKTPNLPKIGFLPENFAEIKARNTSGSGNIKGVPFVKEMLSLGYGNWEELMEIGGIPSQKSSTIREAIRKNIDLYVPHKDALETMNTNSEDQSTGSTKANTEEGKDAQGNVVPELEKADPSPMTQMSKTEELNSKSGSEPTDDGSDLEGLTDTSETALSEREIEEFKGIKTKETSSGKARLNTSFDILNNFNADQKVTTKRRTLASIYKSKAKTLKVKKGRGPNFKQKLVGVLNHGIERASANVKFDLLLTGDPGVGKTTFIRQLSQIAGVPLVTIEAPHISAEHLINIPFVITDSTGVEGGEMRFSKDGGKSLDKLDIENAESNLRSLIRKKKALKGDTNKWLRKLRNNQRLLKMVKSDQKLNDLILYFRKHYDAIMFIDEYFRNDDPKIRNILRGVLNGNIGSDPIPPRTYMIYASNMYDSEGGAVAGPQENTQMLPRNFDKADKNDWKDWYIGKYHDDRQNAINLLNTGDFDKEDKHNLEKMSILPETDRDLLEGLIDAVPDDMFGENDRDSEVRLSPRRFEQIVSGVNALMLNLESSENPAKDARAIYSFLRTNLRHYKTGEVSEKLFEKLASVVEKQITERTGLTVRPASFLKPTEWRDEVGMQLRLKTMLKRERSYPFLIGGEPGIGKTVFVNQVAQENDMRTIVIDASTLTKDDVLGIPLPDGYSEDEGESKKQVKFSKPPLYDRIMRDYEKNRREYNKERVARGLEARPDGYEIWQVLFIDEFTRVEETAVYNSLRKVMLERDFGGGYKLPDDVILMGALNPHDTGDYVKDLTDHMRDVVDVIGAEPSWDEFYEYLSGKLKMGVENKKDPKKNLPSAGDYQKAVGFDITRAVLEGVTEIIKNNHGTEYRGLPIEDVSQYFYWDMGGDTFYVNPRETEEIFLTVRNSILSALSSPEHVIPELAIEDDEEGLPPSWSSSDVGDMTSEEQVLWKEVVGRATEMAINQFIEMSAYKYAETNKVGVMSEIDAIVNNTKGYYLDHFDVMFEDHRNKSTMSIYEMISKIPSIKSIDDIDDSAWTSYITDVMNPEIVQHDVARTIQDMYLQSDISGDRIELFTQAKHFTQVFHDKLVAKGADSTNTLAVREATAKKFRDIGPALIQDVDGLLRRIIREPDATAQVRELINFVGDDVISQN